jgi:hypothetical protein
MTPDAIKASLCAHFCDDLRVRETQAGLAISSSIVTDCGDRIAFFVQNDGAGVCLMDDGEFLSTLEARGIDIGTGTRLQFIEGILREANAYWDRDTYEIKSRPLETLTPAAAVSFMAALVRLRDIRFWTREAVRSTFKEDVAAAIEDRFSDLARVSLGKPVNDDFAEFPADVVVEPKQGGIATAVYLVNSNDGVNEALSLWQEAQRLQCGADFRVMAILEDELLQGINRRKFQRMANRIDSVAYYRGDERATLDRLSRTAGISAAR